MGTHHDTCGCESHAESRKELFYRWLLIAYIIGITFFGIRPLLIRQLLSRITAYEMAGESGQALRVCRKAVMIDRKNAVVWDTLGHFYRMNGDLNKATEAYQAAVAIEPKLKSSQLNLGSILVLQKKYQEAVPHLEQIRALGPAGVAEAKADILIYHKLALQLLTDCYQALQQADKNQEVMKELQQFYPVHPDLTLKPIAP